MIFNMDSGVKGMPKFTYTGSYEVLQDKPNKWAIAFTSAGTLRLNTKAEADAFLVASGSKGGDGNDSAIAGKGGNGGSWLVEKKLELEKGTAYEISIAEITSAVTSRATTAFGLTTADGNAGGAGGTYQNGGTGKDGIPCFNEEDTDLYLDTDGTPKLFSAGGGIGYCTNETGHSMSRKYGGKTGGGRGRDDSKTLTEEMKGRFYGAGGGGGRGRQNSATLGAQGYQGIVIIRNAR